MQTIAPLAQVLEGRSVWVSGGRRRHFTLKHPAVSVAVTRPAWAGKTRSSGLEVSRGALRRLPLATARLGAAGRTLGARWCRSRSASPTGPLWRAALSRLAGAPAVRGRRRSRVRGLVQEGDEQIGGVG